MKQWGTSNSKAVLVQEYFETHATDWQSIYTRTNQQSLNIQRREAYLLNYVDSLALKKGSRILDLGCGAGLTIHSIAPSSRMRRISNIELGAV